jgi:hypothetical protein
LKVDLLKRKSQTTKSSVFDGKWPERSLHDEDIKPIRFHKAQDLLWDSERRMLVMSAGTQSGKDLDIRTLIPTPNGCVSMENLKVGDYVLDENRNPTRVLYVSPVFTDHKCYKLKFGMGQVITAGEDHLWVLGERPLRLYNLTNPVSTKDIYRIWKENDLKGYGSIKLVGDVITLINIEETATVPTQCITVDNPTGIYLCGIQGIPTHNTSWGPWWLAREIYDRQGPGDYLAVTSSFDLFKLKMLPSMLVVFVQILNMGRYWGGDRIIELRDPNTGEFWATKSSDPMWGRIILRSADALSGLESATAKAGWLDECGQDRFTLEAYQAIRRRLALKRGRILMTTTLYNIGWLTQKIIDPAGAEQDSVLNFESVGQAEIEVTESIKKNTLVVQFDSILNPSFPMEEYEEARATLPDEDFQMLYRGRKAARRFLIYDVFNPNKHLVRPFQIPPTWKRYIGVDFGGTHTCAVFFAEDPNTRTLYCYREYLAGNKTIEQHVKDILKYEDGVPWAYGGARSEDQWRTEFGQHGLPISPPLTDDVDLGINRVYALHAADGVLYFDNLSGILDEKGRYRRKRDKSGNALEEIEQKNTFHRMDAERYILGTIRPGSGMRMKIVTLGES